MSYNWFCEDGNVEDPLEEQKTLKFRGDLAYRRKQYQSCFSLIPAGNISVKRDVLEGIARCCCQQGKKEEALNACEKLVNIDRSIQHLPHLTCVLQLELSVDEHYRDLTNSISSLQQLCCLHPYYPWHWLNLAMSFQRLLESDGCPDRRSTEEEHDQQQGTSNILRLKTIMCLIRTRYFSFMLENSKRALRDIEEALHVLQPTENMLQTVSEAMAENLNPEKMREENQDGESLSGLYIKEFDERWWNKLHTKMQEKTPALSMHRPLERHMNNLNIDCTFINECESLIGDFTVTEQNKVECAKINKNFYIY
uniref:Zgc:101716 n=1 Tax=Cyprinus carpio carpio TaxID=630221 RepID=A0A9J8AFH2_CYPCA